MKTRLEEIEDLLLENANLIIESVEGFPMSGYPIWDLIEKRISLEIEKHELLKLYGDKTTLPNVSAVHTTDL